MLFRLDRIRKTHTSMAYCCKIATAAKWHHASLFLGSDKNVLIRLQSPTFVYTRLVPHLRSSTFVCELSTFVYTRLHSSSELPVFLE